MPPKKGGGVKKKTAGGYKMPAHMPPGTLLTDLAKRQWQLGSSVGSGGFGELYLAREQGGKGQECVVKIEPHENGPLFVEMHYYLSAGKPDHLASWKSGGGAGRAAPHLPLLRGSGSHTVGGEKYRFLVIDKLGRDLDKTFENGASPLDMGTIARVAVQVLDCLQYIHSRGYTHNDVKAANLLQGPEPDSWYLVDFGLVVKFQKGEELAHKEYRADPRKAHDGTIEYLSRDAHIGCTARRSDLENLALCLVHWTSGALPWLHLIKGPPPKVQAAKEQFFKELPGSAEHLPAPVKELLLYVAELQFEEAPDYSRCRDMFLAAAKVQGGKVAAKTKAKQVVKKVAAAPKKSGANGFHAEDKSEVSEEEEDDDDDEVYSPSPVKKGKKPVVKKVVKSPVVKNMVKSPVKKKGKSPVKKKGKSPAKMVKSPAKKSTQTADTDSDCDMFAASPPPAQVAATKQYSSSSSQTSPAFVASSKAARREGRQALARVEGGKVATPELARREGRQALARVEEGKVATPAKSTPKRKAVVASEAGGGEPGLENLQPGMENPTPAMQAILARRQGVAESRSVEGDVPPTAAMLEVLARRQLAAEESGKKRKKART